MLQGRDLKGRWGVYQADAQTGEVTPLVLDPKREIWFPSWGHDGKTIYFSRFPLGRYASGGGFSQGGGESIWIERDLASGSEKELLRGPFVAGGVPSPDGRYIVASAVDAASRSRLKLILPAEGGEPRVVARLDAEVEAADLPVFGKGVGFGGERWAPDSHSFFTIKHFNNGRPDEIWRVPVDGSGPVKIDFGDVLSLHAGLPAILFRPEGSQIAFVVTERTLPQDRGYQLWALENFLPTLTAKE
jgi:hypothetical protein